MSIEVQSLPVFQTERGQLIDTPATLPDLRYGFVLSESGVFLPGQISDNVDLHTIHTNVGAELLKAQDIIAGYDPVVEYIMVEFPELSDEHMDGLVGRYYQAHTTHPSDTGENSALILYRYELSQGEHEAMMVLQSRGFGSTGSHVVPMNPPLPGVYFGSISALLDSGHRPANVIHANAGPNATIVFPNGYDATCGSAPSDLYTHLFRTQATDEHDGSRMLSLSRIEPVLVD